MWEMSNSKYQRWILALVQVLVIIHTVFATPFTPVPGSLLLPNGPNPPRVDKCNRSSLWISTKIQHEDCLAALELFRRQEGQKRGTQRFEFLSPGARKTSPLLPLATPRMYFAKTCSVAILMMRAIPPAFLPPGMTPQSSWPMNEVETLDVLKNAAAEVVRECVSWGKAGGFPLAGWVARGQLGKGLGVFVFQTGSEMYKMVRNERAWGDPGTFLDADVNRTFVA
ncbi:MAG: hypothetical protein Q9182_004757 [Xanthomendoza sp. 2 TL-2023]